MGTRYFYSRGINLDEQNAFIRDMLREKGTGKPLVYSHEASVPWEAARQIEASWLTSEAEAGEGWRQLHPQETPPFHSLLWIPGAAVVYADFQENVYCVPVDEGSYFADLVRGTLVHLLLSAGLQETVRETGLDNVF